METAPPRPGVYDSLGLRLSFLEWGDPAAPPVLLVHGGLDNAWAWTEIAADLGRDHRVVAIDLRGHGDSDWSQGGDYHTHAFLGDLASFVAATFSQPVILIGHSMGARLSLLFTGAMPDVVAKLVAIEGLRAAGPEETGGVAGAKLQDWVAARWARQSADHVTQVGRWLRARTKYKRPPPRGSGTVEAVMDRLLAKQEQQLTPAQARRFAETNMREAANGDRVWKFDPAAKWYIGAEAAEPDARLYFSRIACPMLNIYGADSWAYPPQAEDLAQFRDGRLVVIPGAGHWTHLNQPAAVLREIRGFLGEPAESAGAAPNEALS